MIRAWMRVLATETGWILEKLSRKKWQLTRLMCGSTERAEAEIEASLQVCMMGTVVALSIVTEKGGTQKGFGGKIRNSVLARSRERGSSVSHQHEDRTWAGC